MKHDITIREQLAAYRELLQKQIAELMKERRGLYRNGGGRQDRGRVYTIEGNSSDQIWQRNYAVDYSSIMGYGITVW